MARTGKYAGVINKLPRFAGEEPKYQEKVEAVKSKIIADDPLASNSSAVLAKAYVKLRTQKEELERIEFDVNLELEAYSQLLNDRFEVEGISSVTLDTGETAARYVEPYATVRDREAFRLWCIMNGYEAQMTLPWTT